MVRSITLAPRRYRDRTTGEWKDGASYRPGDLTALILALEKAREYCLTTPVAVPEAKEEPPLPPPAPVLSAEERATAAKQRYEATLRLLEAAGLDDVELKAGKEKAKQQYLRDLDEVTRGPVQHPASGSDAEGQNPGSGPEHRGSPHEAAVILDPHKQSLAYTVLRHAAGNILFERLSDIQFTLGFEFLTPSTNPDARLRQQENHRRAEAFVAILLRRRGDDGMANTPLMEEWVMAAIMLYLFQATSKPLTLLPFAFLPESSEFSALVRDCTLPEIQHKFQQIANLKARDLRAEVGSATRLINAVFRAPEFAARSRGGFDLGQFLQQGGKLIVERGEEMGGDTMRVIMGAIVLLVIDHAKRRPSPYPPIRIVIDEATNARLVGGPELRGIAETNKNGLFWDFLVQNLDFPGGADGVLQNCVRHEWFGCPFYDLARKAATDTRQSFFGTTNAQQCQDAPSADESNRSWK